MKGITVEKVVSSEVAKLLKQCGFPQKGTGDICYDYYDSTVEELDFNNLDKKKSYAIPTIALAAQWLYANKQLYITMYNTADCESTPRFFTEVVSRNRELNTGRNITNHFTCINGGEYYFDPFIAMNDTIKRCCNFILKK